jgi:hypothetical protein
LNGQPVVLHGLITAEQGLSRINVPTTLSPDPNAIAGFGVPTVTIQVAAGAELQFNEPATIDAADLSGEGTITFNESAAIGGTTSVDLGEVKLGPAGTLAMIDGQVQVENFIKDAAASFALQGGTFSVAGGDAAFNSAFSFGGPEPTAPFVRVENGADAVVTSSWKMAPSAGDSANTIVTGSGGGQRSTLRGTVGGGGADMVVGENGRGVLLVDAGGLVDLRDDFIIGQNANSHGQATVIGVQSGFRSTVDVTGGGTGSSVQIGGGDGGGGSLGILNIQEGGLVQTSADVVMARYASSQAFTTVGGMAGGFPAELNVEDDIFVGGTATTAGGEATITLDASGLLRADEMIVWGGGTVAMNGGEMFLDTLDLATGGGEFNLLGGVLHVDTIDGSFTNDGGTISPGGSPGATEILGDYRHNLDANLLIELTGLAPETEHDVFSVTGDLGLAGGALEVVLRGFMPAAGDDFDILNFGSQRGEFDLIKLPMLPTTLTWDASQLYNTGVLSVVSAEKSADFDNDGDVDGDDLGAWAKFFATEDLADADADGDSDGSDFLLWQQQVGSPPALAAAAAVPEPATLSFALMALLAAAWRRRACPDV